MNLLHIEHIGIAVSDLDRAVTFYEKAFGLKCQRIEEVKDQKVRAAIFYLDKTRIELLESTDPEGPVGKFIASKGEGFHHIAFAVNNIEEQLESAVENGIRLIDRTPRIGADGHNIAFLHPKSTFGVLTELCENEPQ